MTGLLVAVGVLLVATAFGLLRRSRDGRVRAVASTATSDPAANSDPATQWVDVAQLGAQPGARATVLQFSSAFCAPCRATRRILAEVAGIVDGVAHVEVDAESHLDLVNQLHVRRTPTVLVLDASGRIVSRASGVPRKADVIAALGRVIDGPVLDAPAADGPVADEAGRDEPGPTS